MSGSDTTTWHDSERMKKAGRAAIFAAGGIVVRGGPQPLIAIVQLRKQNDWVLPKGKLIGNESALAAAKREVLEETGHDVSVHEFLGTMSYDVGSRPKIVQFWRMQAIGGPVRKLMHDVKAVRWLPLDEALGQLTHSREQVFLANVGPIAIAPPSRRPRRPLTGSGSSRPSRSSSRTWSNWPPLDPRGTMSARSPSRLLPPPWSAKPGRGCEQECSQAEPFAAPLDIRISSALYPGYLDWPSNGPPALHQRLIAQDDTSS